MNRGLKAVKLGYVPISKFVFSAEDAGRYKVLVQEKLRKWGVHFVSIDGVTDEGMLYKKEDLPKVVEHLKKEQVDALFCPHCNFGTEGAVGMICKKLGVPVLLWGPRDEAPLSDGSRYRDSLCGMFASSKVLHKLKVPFTYIEN